MASLNAFVVESVASHRLTSEVLYGEAALRFPLRVWLAIPARFSSQLVNKEGQGQVSKGAPFLRVVMSENEPVEVFTSQDVARLEAAIGLLRRLVDDPVALIDRAKRLLEGTAPKLFGVAPGLHAYLALSTLAALDIPGPFDDWARLAVGSLPF